MKSIERMPVVEQVTTTLKEYIQSDERQVGEKLPTEKELCAELCVGRSTLREAVRILQASGFVENRPGKGAFIANKEGYVVKDAVQWISENKVTLRDFIEVRMAIEELAIRLAIERATDKEIQTLVKIHGEFLEAVKKDDSDKTPKLDAKFHSQIAKMTHNNLLISVNRQVTSYLDAFRKQTFRIPRNTQNSVSPHSAIVDAFLRRDVNGGVYEMHLHFKQMFEDLEKEPSEPDDSNTTKKGYS